MKIYLFSAYALLLCLFATLLHSHTPMNEALAIVFAGAALAMLPIIELKGEKR